jgi:glutathione S-transferase
VELVVAITVWGRLNSANVQKVIWTLGELDLPYAHVPIGGLFGGLDAPAFRAMNPNGQVPTIRDDDLVLWESHAIVRYLAGRYDAGGLWPSAPVERAVADQWTDWAATTFQPAWLGLFWLLVRTPQSQHDPVAIARSLAHCHSAFEILDQRLQQVPYLGGERLSYADVVAGVAMFRWMSMKVEREELPGLAAWYGRLLERPLFVAAVCLPYADLVGRLHY